MSFTDYLESLPLDRLKEIVRRRAFQIRSVPRMRTKRELCAWLAQILSDAFAVRTAFDETDLMQARLLIGVVAQDGEMSRQAIVEMLGVDSRERLEEAADGLESLGLAIRRWAGDNWALWTPSSVRQNVPLPLPLRYKLQPTLERYNGEALYHMVAYLGIADTGLTSKGARSRAIAHRLLHADGPDVMELISDEARRILDFVLRKGGTSNLHELGMQLDTRRRNQLYSYDWSYRWYGTNPRNPVEELLSCGLLVLSGEVGFQYGAILIAGDMLERITGQGLLTADLPAEPVWEIDSTAAAVRTHDALARDVAYFLGYLSRNETGRTGKGIIHRTALKNVSKALSTPLPPYASYLYAVCRAGGLIDTVDPDACYSITKEGEDWLALDRYTQARQLYSAWLRQRLWVETAPDLLLDETEYVDRDEVLSVRTTVIDLLRRAALEHPGQLVSKRSLAAHAHYARWSSFNVDPAPEQDGAESGLDVDRGSLSGSDLVGRVLAALYWLGMVEGATSSAPLLNSVRLTPLGRLVLLEEPVAEAPLDVATFVVQPNLEIYAPPNLTADLYYHLFRIADPKAGGMLVLTKDSLRKAMDRGLTATALLDFLRKHSSTGLPQNVEYLVKEVGGKHGHIRVGHAGLYLVVDDPIMLKELAAQKKLSVSVRRQLSDTVALVTGESVEAVLKELRQAGYLPVADRNEKRRTRTASVRKGQLLELHESAASVLAAIPWDTLEGGGDTQSDGGAQTTRSGIREVVEEALRRHVRMEYAGVRDPQQRQIVLAEPVGLAGSLLRVYLPREGHFGILNLSQIHWARLTDEPFEPRTEPARLSHA